MLRRYASIFIEWHNGAITNGRWICELLLSRSSVRRLAVQGDAWESEEYQQHHGERRTPEVNVGTVVRVRWSDRPEVDRFTIVPDYQTAVTVSGVAASARLASAALGHFTSELVAIGGVDHSYAVTVVSAEAEDDDGRGRLQ